MQTDLPHQLLATERGTRADSILRSCVHCGFCNATCPTYQLLGDELDGPRGRIYLIKEMLETGEADSVTRTHLDRCLTCRACETTCPSGVRYGELLEIGRDYLEAELPRPVPERWIRRWLLAVVPERERFRRWLRLGRAFGWLLPRRIARYCESNPGAGGSDLPVANDSAVGAISRSRFARWVGIRDRGRAPLGLALAERAHEVAPTEGEVPTEGEAVPTAEGDRDLEIAPARGAQGRVLVLNGCVQGAATPEVNVALEALLAARGIEVLYSDSEQCCGALALHLGESARAQVTMAANVDALVRELDEVDAVISTASGCGVTVKDYGRLLADDPMRKQAAERVAGQTLDVCEYLGGLGGTWQRSTQFRRVAWHSPCTLQHGQQIRGPAESLLEQAGYELVPVADAHLCCGSAGTYSILQPELAGRLRAGKLECLERRHPDVIATANVGCQLHLAPEATVPVVHWLALLR